MRQIGKVYTFFSDIFIGIIFFEKQLKLDDKLACKLFVDKLTTPGGEIRLPNCVGG